MSPPVVVENEPLVLTRVLLAESLELGKSFILNNQREEGNFQYEYNLLTQEYTNDDNQVRQAGAFWALALMHADQPSEETRKAFFQAFAFFAEHATTLPDGRMLVQYPGEKFGKTGTIALVTLALGDFLSAEAHGERSEEIRDALEAHLALLLSLRREDGHFYSNYDFSDGSGWGTPSPYFDGEALLALTKAAKYAGYERLTDSILASAERMYQDNVVMALTYDPDSAITKGFYQWGTMSFFELFTSGWEGTEQYARRAVDMAYWMIDVHRTLDRTRNTGYAYEGIVSAYELARLLGDTDAQRKFSDVIDQGLAKLTSWQVGSPIQNAYLSEHALNDPYAIGGVMNRRDEPLLRIDVAQHQMHAVILARRFVYH